MQGIIIISIILTFLSQTSESSDQNNFEMLQQTLSKARFCTEDNGQHKDNSISSDIDSNSQTKAIKTEVVSGKTLNRTITILLWKFWDDGIMDGAGFQPFQTCLYKNCLSTRDKSLLHNPKHIIDAIVFYGGKDQFIDDLNEMKQFKESKELVQQMNQGIKPKIVLFIAVRNQIKDPIIYFIEGSCPSKK